MPDFLSFLKNHPFAVEAFFERSVVLTFAAPKERVRKLVPACLETDNFDDRWAFVAVAMVQTKGLRPKGFPKFLGNDFFLVGYRVFVRYTSNSGKHLRGLYILKSETDKRLMQWMGNTFTCYRYTTTDISQNLDQGNLVIASARSGFSIELALADAAPVLPPASPFPDWKSARKFAGPLPFTFSVDQRNNEVLLVKGVRQNWIPEPVTVTRYRLPFLDELCLGNSVLANAFAIRNIPYRWEKGKPEKWKI